MAIRNGGINLSAFEDFCPNSVKVIRQRAFLHVSPLICAGRAQLARRSEAYIRRMPYVNASNRGYEAARFSVAAIRDVVCIPDSILLPWLRLSCPLELCVEIECGPIPSATACCILFETRVRRSTGGFAVVRKLYFKGRLLGGSRGHSITALGASKNSSISRN